MFALLTTDCPTTVAPTSHADCRQAPGQARDWEISVPGEHDANLDTATPPSKNMWCWFETLIVALYV